MNGDTQNIISNIVEVADTIPSVLTDGQNTPEVAAFLAYYPWSNVFTFSVFVSFLLLIVLLLVRQMKSELDCTTKELGKAIKERTDIERLHYDDQKRLQQTQRELLNSKYLIKDVKAELV